jgi:hypothetical protein
MKCNWTIFFDLLRHGITLCAAVSLLLASQAVHADPITWMPSSYEATQSLLLQHPATKEHTLNFDAGNIVIHSDSSALGLVYEPAGYDHKERVGLAPPNKVSIGLGSVGLKLAFTF